MEIRKIYPFENHPFKVINDEKMQNLVESIKKNGVESPVLLRPNEEGNHEMISGHRRMFAAKKIGLRTLPAIVRNMTDDEATIFMVDANIQRVEILPSCFHYTTLLICDCNHFTHNTYSSLKFSKYASIRSILTNTILFTRYIVFASFAKCTNVQ